MIELIVTIGNRVVDNRILANILRRYIFICFNILIDSFLIVFANILNIECVNKYDNRKKNSLLPLTVKTVYDSLIAADFYTYSNVGRFLATS